MSATTSHIAPENTRWVVCAADIALAPAVHGNRVRALQLVEALRAAGFRVAYLFWDRSGREADIEAMRALVDELVVVRTTERTLKSTLTRRFVRLARQAAQVLDRKPFRGQRSRPAWNDRAWWWLVRERDPEAVCASALFEPFEHLLASRTVVAAMVTYVSLVPLLRIARARSILTILDSQDVNHQRAEKLRAQSIKPSGLLVKRDEETRLLQQADLVLAIQPAEAVVLAEMIGAEKVITVEHGVPLPADFTAPVSNDEHVVLLASNNRMNQHGLAWFLELVWPQVLSAVPGAQLFVFGPLSGTHACHGPRVVAAGFAPHVKDAYAQARVVIAPLLAGSGLKIKTVEALAYGRAVVTTSVGAEGLENAPPGVFALADDPHEFALAVVSFLRDRARAAEFGQNAARFARERFSIESAYEPLIAVLRERSASLRS
jgi:glycosyltransferase involved in cell wall biosynthesis